jgi:hypothetical protein
MLVSMRELMVDNEVIGNGVQLACRAPSLHNSQPWRWVLENSTLQLYSDPRRVPRSADNSGREALIGCGVALDHFRVAMAAAGWTAHVDRFPDPANQFHVASVEFSPLADVTGWHRRRADAILLRRTDRLPFAAPPGWGQFESQLRRAADTDLVRIDVIADDLRSMLADASQLAESLRLYDSSYHDELSWWTVNFKLTDGIPHSSLVSAAESDRVDVGRNFPVTPHCDRRPGLAEDHSKIVVLSTYGETRHGILRCGEALSGVLLDAAMIGLATCTLTHITEVPASRDIVAGLIGQAATPQVLIRVGLAPSIEDVSPTTPRRPLRDVFTVLPAGSATFR